MDLPLLSALFAAFALTLYVLLDGFDLGVGALLLLERDQDRRDRMIDAILPTWDGNETWLIMAGVALLAAFPIAYGVLLPAFYLVLVPMLLGLGLRGVSFEFRIEPGAARRRWDGVFAFGSIAAALAQGLVVGGLIEGVAVSDNWFAGTPFDVFTPFSLLTAVALLSGYMMLGAGWLHLKGSDATRAFARACLVWLAPSFSLLAITTCIAAAAVQPRIAAIWAAWPMPLALLSLLFLGCAGRLAVTARARACPSDAEPFLLGLIMMISGIAGLGFAVFPDVIPFRVSLWDAASATESHIFLLWGAIIVTPIVLAYSAFSYFVFRGKTPVKGWDP